MYRNGNEDDPVFGSSVRAGDADREATVERLRENHAEGRIDVAEFQERLDSAYEAKTLGELRKLVSDLPQKSEDARDAGWLGALRARPIRPLIAVALAIALLSAIPALLGVPGYRHHPGPGPWLLIPMFLLARLFFWRHRPRARRRRHSPTA